MAKKTVKRSAKKSVRKATIDRGFKRSAQRVRKAAKVPLVSAEALDRVVEDPVVALATATKAQAETEDRIAQSRTHLLEIVKRTNLVWGLLAVEQH